MRRPLRSLLRAPDLLYRAGLGRLLGHRFLRLTHTGRRSGTRYTTVLEVVHHDPRGPEFVVVSGFGQRADWLRNIEAAGRAEVTVGGLTFGAVPRRLDTAEAVAVMADYERRNRMLAPLLRPVLSRLTGARYDGSPAARQRLAERLPMIALRPAAR